MFCPLLFHACDDAQTATTHLKHRNCSPALPLLPPRLQRCCRTSSSGWLLRWAASLVLMLPTCNASVLQCVTIGEFVCQLHFDAPHWCLRTKSLETAYCQSNSAAISLVSLWR